jgi:broad specificity phosphatase PhoE
VPTSELWIVRHGETEWSRDGRHTSTTDIDLTPEGEEVARGLAGRLADADIDLVLTSPRTRARRTAELAGFPDAHLEDDLVEWDYGDYDGRTAAEIRQERPGWTPWQGGFPGGETLEQVAARAARVGARARRVEGDVALFAHGHILRVIAARWLEQPPVDAARYYLAPASVSVLGWERETSVIDRWNEACHLEH